MAMASRDRSTLTVYIKSFTKTILLSIIINMIKIFAYLAVYIIWGTTYFFMKFAVTGISPYYVVGIRNFGSFMLLIGAGLLLRQIKSFPSIKQIMSSIIIGTCLLVGGSGFVMIAVKGVDSYMASLVISCTPLVVVFTDRFLLGNKVDFSAVVGILIGLLGVGILLFDGQSFVFTYNPYFFLLFAAVLSWSLGTSLSKKLPLPDDSFTHASIQFIVIGLACVIGMQFVEPIQSVAWSEVSLNVWLSVAYLSFFGSIAFASFHYLVKNEPNYRVVTYTFINPAIAMFIGIVLGNEAVVAGLLPGCFLIFVSLIIIFYYKSIKKAY